MGVYPSRTELFYPAESIRPCHPDRCWCNGGHHRSVKYVYTERGGDGREQNHDVLDMMRELMMDGGIGGARAGPGGRRQYPMMPWRPAKDWTVRDYERLGEILNEYYTRENGRRGGGGGGGGMYTSHMPGFDGSGGRSSSRRHRYPSWNEFERMQESVEDKFRRMADEYQRHMQERDAMLFGSKEDAMKERYKNNMLRTLHELMPQLAQMWAGGPLAQEQFGGGLGGPGGMGGAFGLAGGPGGGGSGMPMNMGLGGMGNMPPGMAGMPGNPWVGGGMGNIGMNPMAAAMGQGMPNQAGMNPHAWPDAMPPNNSARYTGGGGGDMGNGWPPRPSRRRKLPLDDGFADGLGPGFGGNHMDSGFRRRRPWDDGGDDMLGGGYGSDMPGGPKRPPPHDPLPPRRPPPDHPPDGRGGGGGGIAFDDSPFQSRRNALDPSRPGLDRHAHHMHHHDLPYPSDSVHDRRPDSTYVNLSTSPPLGLYEPMMTGGRGPRSPAPLHRTHRDDYAVPGAAAFHSTGPDVDFAGAHLDPGLRTGYATRVDLGGRKEGGFQPEAKLAQSREAEMGRGEVPLGSPGAETGLMYGWSYRQDWV